MEISVFLETQYGVYTSEPNCYLRSQILFNIINVKVDNKEWMSFQRPIYGDIKEFIIEYLGSIDTLSYGFDSINLERIEGLLPILPPQERLSIVNFLTRKLKLQGFEEEYKACLKMRDKAELDAAYERNFFLWVGKGFLYLSSRDLRSLIVSTLLYFLIFFVILLPNSHKNFQIFEVRYDNYSNHYIVNHAFNLICSAIDLGENFKVKPLNTFALALLILGKLSFVFIIGNFVIQEITKKITD